MNRWARDVLIMAAATSASRLLGLFRDVALAHRFGTSAAYDAFLIAFFVPHFLRQLLAEGALSTAMVPVYTGLQSHQGNRSDADRFASNLISWLLLLFPALIVIGIVSAPYYVPFLASGFGPEKLALSVRLTQIVFPFIGIIGLAALVMGILHAHHRFFSASVSPVGFNLGMLLGILLLATHTHPPILGVGIGVLLGGALQLGVQLPALAKMGFQFRFRLFPLHPGIRSMAQLMAPAVLTLAVTEVNLLVDNKLASYLGDGGISALQYSMRLFQLPLGVLAVSVATALLPRLSAAWSNRRERAFFAFIDDGVVASALVLLPAMVGLIVLGPDIVRLLFEHGSFSPDSTVRTARALSFYAIGLVPYGWVYVLTRAAYARGRPVFPLAASAVAASVNIVLDLVLVTTLREAGLALATSIAGIGSAALLAGVLLWKRGPSRGTLQRLSWILAGSGLLLIVVWSIRTLLPNPTPATAVFAPTAAGLLVYGLFVRFTPLWRFVSSLPAQTRGSQ
jgi:putative peptidoglycan lipid II flippase